MKKLILPLVLLLIASCSNDNEVVSQNSSAIDKEKRSNLYYDEVYKVVDGVQYDITNEQYSGKNVKNYFPIKAMSATNTYEFYDITPINPAFTFLGATISSLKLESNGIMAVAGTDMDKKRGIYVSSSLPVYLENAYAPNNRGSQKAVIDLVNGSGFNGDQLVSFTYSMKQIYKYKEMKLTFGANVNIGGFFDLGVDINNENSSFTSTMMVNFVQTNFDIAMDMPEDGNIYLTDAIRSKFSAQKPIYINSIQYGRRGILLARSSESYSKFSAAIRAAFSIGAADIEANLSYDQKEILKNADIQICIIGGKGDDVTATINGFENFKEFIKKGGNYTKTTYGVPISYSAVYADTNELYVSKVNL